MVQKTQVRYAVSERRACRVLLHPRATHRYESVRDDQAALRSRIRELAGVHVTWGYPRIWVKLRREDWAVDRKRGTGSTVKKASASGGTNRVVTAAA